MRTVNSLLIRGPVERIFELAARIEDWPAILPHYRFVILVERGENWCVARMGASRDGFPVKWKARQELLPGERRILFRHVGGITRGMEVEWRLDPGPEGVAVTISHDLTYPVPLLGPLFARYVVGALFVHNIAGKTLRCIQRIVESEARAGSSLPASAP